jgi:hypothetical protein
VVRVTSTVSPLKLALLAGKEMLIWGGIVSVVTDLPTQPVITAVASPKPSIRMRIPDLNIDLLYFIIGRKGTNFEPSGMNHMASSCELSDFD